MKVYLLRFYVIAIFLAMSFTANANKSYELYVGQSTFVSCPDPPRGSIFQTSWASRHGSVSVKKMERMEQKLKSRLIFLGRHRFNVIIIGDGMSVLDNIRTMQQPITMSLVSK